MNELYKSLGFNKNPFTKFSAEEEKEYLSQIYLKPRYYNSIFSDLLDGSSRHLVGFRGSGKTALILELKRDLNLQNAFTIVIDSYDGIPIQNNQTKFLEKVIREIILNFVVSISQTPSLLRKLNKYEKEKLSFFIGEFFQTLSRQEFESVYNKVTKYKFRNFFYQTYNYILNRPINFFLSGTVEIVADTISNSFGLPRTRPEDFYKNYIPEVPLEKIKKSANPEIFMNDYGALKKILNDLSAIIKKTGFKSVVVFFDRIDEYSILEAKLENIVNFTKEILKDTDLLYSQNLSLVFSIWSEVKNELNQKGVRFDKFKPIDVTWSINDIAKILEKRLNYFHTNKKGIEDITDPQEVLGDLYSLSNNSPRDLIRLFSTIYDEQSIDSPTSNILTLRSVELGKEKFAKEYDYYSLFPSTKSKKENVINNINRVLRMAKEVIKIKDMISVLKVSHPTAISYIKILKDYRIVKELGELDVTAKQYQVNDPKLKYLISKGIKNIQ